MTEQTSLSIGEFLERIEKINQERLDDDEWSLNDRQKEAIKHGTAPLWMTAGPGSGKTEVLVIRVLKLVLVDDVSPGSILITTFTEKAAQSLEERIAERFDAFESIGEQTDINKIYIGTLHSICDEVMNEYRYPDYANIELMDEIGQDLFIHDNSDLVDFIHPSSEIDPEKWDSISEEEVKAHENKWEYFEQLCGWRVNDEYGPNRWQSTDIASKLLDRASQYDVSVDDMTESDNFYTRAVGESLEHYRETLEENHRCDFARVLEKFNDFLDHQTGEKFLRGTEDEDGIEYILVDEYQDTNPLQEKLYFRMCQYSDDVNITVVGDDDQSLYRFRGGTVECLIRFPERIEDRFKISPRKINLKRNYRSIEDIVDWINRYIGETPVMNQEGARAENKEPMISMADNVEKSKGVLSLFEDNHVDAAEKVAELIYLMKERDYIEDYSQIALLFNTTRESKTKHAGPYVRALEDEGIDVHNPRNKKYLEREEIQFLMGSILHCIHPDLPDEIGKFISGRVRNQLEKWYRKFPEYVDSYDARELEKFVEKKKDRVEELDGGEKLDVTLLELVYQIISFDPFFTWTESEEYKEKADRLARATSLLEDFSRVSGWRLLKISSWLSGVSRKFLDDFYWGFCGLMNQTDLDDPEDQHDQIPEGNVQVMTVHQAKGLEFPVVFVGDLEEEPRETSDTYWVEDLFREYSSIDPPGSASQRAERDFVRQFYVAYSRAESNLILIGKESDPSSYSLGYDDEGNPLDREWFESDRRISGPEEFFETQPPEISSHSRTELKRRYSITGDVLTYKLCRRQYGFFNEIGFIPSYEALWSFGRLIHDTLDRAHRHYQGDIEGVDGGTVPSDDDIEEYFEGVMNALRAQNIYQIGEKASEKALENIKRFNQRMGPDLYPRVRDTEHKLQSTQQKFILEGVVDVIVEGDDIEIWDYKASKKPPESDQKFSNYASQLKTYAQLYREKNGSYPDRGVIYFMGEETPDDAKFIIDIDPDEVQEFMDDFKGTVDEIRSSREEREWFDIDPEELPPEDICDSCGIRWSCSARNDDYSLI